MSICDIQRLTQTRSECHQDWSCNSQREAWEIPSCPGPAGHWLWCSLLPGESTGPPESWKIPKEIEMRLFIGPTTKSSPKNLLSLEKVLAFSIHHKYLFIRFISQTFSQEAQEHSTKGSFFNSSSRESVTSSKSKIKSRFESETQWSLTNTFHMTPVIFLLWFPDLDGYLLTS